MDFKKATDRVQQLGVTQAEIGAVLGVAAATVRAARLDPSSSSYRRPPDGWETPIAKLARERAAKLLNLAAQLEGDEDPMRFMT